MSSLPLSILQTTNCLTVRLHFIVLCLFITRTTGVKRENKVKKERKANEPWGSEQNLSRKNLKTEEAKEIPNFLAVKAKKRIDHRSQDLVSFLVKLYNLIMKICLHDSQQTEKRR